MSLPLDPLFNAVLAAVAPFGVALYGVSWVAFGEWLLCDASESELSLSTHDRTK